ncbi:MAG: hypothetical protein M1822_008434 [Bathelium mastoideum]|nr:MAG: hypothetical protein M1822_008434 [Bathelium mastoideum]
MTLRMIKLGVGKHATDVSEANVSEILKLLWVNEFLFTPGLTLAKSSALFFYERVFHNANSRFKSALWIVQIATYLWMVGVLLAVATLCIPAEKNWKPSVPGHCVNVDTFWLANGITSIMIDVIILILPLPMLWQLQMKLSNKILLIGVFICGYLVVVVAIGRIISTTKAGTAVETDPTWNFVGPFKWFGAEIAASVISVSLPSIFFLVRRTAREGFQSLYNPHHTRSKLGDSGQRDTEAGYTRKSSASIELNSGSTDGLAPTWVPSPEPVYQANAIKASPSASVLYDGRIRVQNEVEVDRSLLK